MEENFLLKIFFSPKLVYSHSLLLKPTAVLSAQAHLTAEKKREMGTSCSALLFILTPLSEI